MPGSDVIEKHARRLVEAKLTRMAIEGIRQEIAQKAAQPALPANLPDLVFALLNERPELPWDAALAEIIRAEK